MRSTVVRRVLGVGSSSMVNLKAREGHEAQVRRDGVEQLAAAVRDLADAAAETGVDRATLDEVTGALRAADATAPGRDRRRRVLGAGGQAGRLLRCPRGRCRSTRSSARAVPSAPTCACASTTARSPAPRRSRSASSGRPASRTAGSAPCSPTRSSPASPGAIGVRTITKALELRYLRPLPLDEEVELWGVCEPDGDGVPRPVHRHPPRRGRGRGRRGARHLRAASRTRPAPGLSVRGATVGRDEAGRVGRRRRACSRACRSRPRRCRARTGTASR